MSETGKLALVQLTLAAAIALTSGLWAYVTYTTGQVRMHSDREQRQALAQEEAKAAMSRQLGLMVAQCKQYFDPKDLAVSSDPLEQGCFRAALEARGLLYVTRVRLARPASMSEDKWSQRWENLEEVLKRAWRGEYTESSIWVAWNRIAGARSNPREET